MSNDPDSHLAAAAAAAMAADSHHSNGAGQRVLVVRAGEAAARTLAHSHSFPGGSAPPAGGNGMDALRKSTCAPHPPHNSVT